jgi:hypothetical protein
MVAGPQSRKMTGRPGRARKWTVPARGPAPAAEPSHARGDFFAIKRGLATGANAFFILDRREAPSYLKTPISGRHGELC